MKIDNQFNGSTQLKNRKKEMLLLAIIFVVIIIIAVVVYGKINTLGSTAIVTIGGEEYGRYSLSKNQEIPIEIDGEVTNYLIIKDGKADMIDADCPDQLCVNMKSISLDGETIVCLPNKVVVEVDSPQSADLDTMVN